MTDVYRNGERAQAEAIRAKVELAAKLKEELNVVNTELAHMETGEDTEESKLPDAHWSSFKDWIKENIVGIALIAFIIGLTGGMSFLMYISCKHSEEKKVEANMKAHTACIEALRGRLCKTVQVSREDSGIAEVTCYCFSGKSRLVQSTIKIYVDLTE